MSNFAPLQRKETRQLMDSSSSLLTPQAANNFTSPIAASPSASSDGWQTESAHAGHSDHSLSQFTISRTEKTTGQRGRQQANLATQPQVSSTNRPLQLQRQMQTATAPVEQGQENRSGLPDAIKAGVENISGYALNDVQVHYNSSEPARIGALAYTQGTQIHVAPGEERHLPHEAWHVVQQKQGRVKPTVQMQGRAINDEVGLESEADVMGGKSLETSIPTPQSDGHGQASAPSTLQGEAAPIQAMMRKRSASPDLTESNQKAQKVEEEEEEREEEKTEEQNGKEEEENKEADKKEEQQGEDYFEYNNLYFSGIAPEATSGWEKQTFKDNCWAAGLACLTGKTQAELLEAAGLTNFNNKTAPAHEIEECMQMVSGGGGKSLKWSKSNPTEVCGYLSQKRPVMVTMDSWKHCIILLAHTSVGAAIRFIVWNPDPGKGISTKDFDDLSDAGASNAYVMD